MGFDQRNNGMIRVAASHGIMIIIIDGDLANKYNEFNQRKW